MMKNKVLLSVFLLFPMISFAAGQMASDRIADIRNTKHNFVASDTVSLPGGATRDITATTKSEDEVCVYCHTPHGDPADVDNVGFLWNRSLPDTTSFQKYSSTTLNAGPQNLGVGSRMCLSCHDGTVAIGQVDVLNGRQTSSDAGFVVDPSVTITTTTDGYTSNIDTDLTNDHPVGFAYNTALATADGEVEDPASSSLIGVPTPGGVANFNNTLAQDFGTDITGSPSSTAGNQSIGLPLESSTGTIAAPVSGDAPLTVATEGQVECTTCHDPHIRSTDNSVNIKFLRLHRFQQSKPTGVASGADEPAFQINTDINCVACHRKTSWSASVHAQADNTYIDSAANLREFPTGTAAWEASCLNCHDPHTETGANWLLRAGADSSGNSAIEETCFECHGNTPVVNDDGATTVANIQALDDLSGHDSMDFDGTNHTHTPQSADLDETAVDLKANRHVTCSDCHNPHRIIQNTAHDGTGTAGSALHIHPTDGITTHTNQLSGALNGASGVMVDDFTAVTFDPLNPAATFSYTELKGVTGDADAANEVTKEYQICLKCHSDYGDAQIGTRANITMELSTAAASYHPVANSSNSNAHVDKSDMTKTDSASFDLAFQQVGTQTMYCSDCHTNDAVAGPQGPHGSTVTNLLAADGDSLCITCHQADQYQTPGGTVQNSGFSCQAPNPDCTVGADTQNNNLHILHAQEAINAGGTGNVCSNCHVKIPHGWRNKALLADINETDLEGLQATYYPDAIININDAGIPASGAWVKADCTAAGCH